MRLITAALAGRRIDYRPIINDSFTDAVQALSKSIYSNSEGRTQSEVYDSCFWGELGERAIHHALLNSSILCEHNNEQSTGEWHWDLLVERAAKIEIKFQSASTDKEYFGFKKKSHDETMRQKWKSFDAVIGFYVEGDDVVPWYLIDNEAINPNLGYYVPSKFTDGYYLQSGRAATAGLVIKLNRDAR